MAEKATLPLHMVFNHAEQLARSQKNDAAANHIRALTETESWVNQEVNFFLIALAFNDPELYTDFILQALPHEEEEYTIAPNLYENTLSVISYILISSTAFPPVFERLVEKFKRLVNEAQVQDNNREAALVISETGPAIQITLGESVYEINLTEVPLNRPVESYEMLKTLAENSGEWILSKEFLNPEWFVDFTFNPKLALTEEEQLKTHIKSIHQATQVDLSHLNRLFKKQGLPLEIKMFLTNDDNSLAYKLVPQPHHEPLWLGNLEETKPSLAPKVSKTATVN